MALSRVRRLDGLYLLGCNEHALKVHPQILEQDSRFSKCFRRNAEKNFDNIRRRRNKKRCIKILYLLWVENGRRKEKEYLSLGGEAPKWATGGRLGQIRTKHQNAYKKVDPRGRKRNCVTI